MASDAFLAGQALGSTLANAVTTGVAQWKQIQLQKQQQKEFEGAVGLYNQRTQTARQAVDPQDGNLLKQYEQQAQRYPQATMEQRPTGGVREEDGQAETEPVIRTPEGDIPMNQVLQLRARKQQLDTQLTLSDIDALMELQARYQNNPLVKQFVASTYSGIQAKQQLRFKQTQQQLLLMEREQAQQRLQLDQERLQEEQRQFDAGPEREREKERFQTDEGIRQDAARIDRQKGADLEVEGVRAQNKPEKAPTELQTKLRQLAPRAQQALEQIEALEGGEGADKLYDRTGAAAALESVTPNALRSGKRQQYEQAQLQFVNSVLRAESGATITDNELTKGVRQYFPQAGDSPETVAQKRQARETAVQGLFSAAGVEAPPKAAAAGGLSSEEQSLIDAVRAGKMTPDEARERRKALRAR